ncbi:2-epi-5-epi-valiolone synthase-like [Artemia franciscana]|uniref:2-epi-5-epi-valiolone synthase n=1 Tax=Artemia franciscana TaxID=6661 RepID=A0AA88HH68_ARTSF|nr:hypothetical protein QYM36_017338 [Artemia franciscana]KAK2705257.1 hypothetical protein QYM36_017338 [Artemia franciscana]
MSLFHIPLHSTVIASMNHQDACLESGSSTPEAELCVEFPIMEPLYPQKKKAYNKPPIYAETMDQYETSYKLVRVKDTWNCVHADDVSVDEQNRVSESLISQRLAPDNNGLSWSIEAPIRFSYNITECTNLLDPSNDVLIYGHLTTPEEVAAAKANPKKRRLVVMDETVSDIYGDKVEQYFRLNGFECTIFALETTEETKNTESMLKIAEAINKFHPERRSEPIIAIGGGVCLDMVGLAATLFRRRTPYIRVPTTLLSLVDASVGAKTGVNFCECKNKLGAYVPPVAVYLDRSFLITVSRRHLSNGMGEILKMALMKHRELFELLETHGQYLLDTQFQDDSPSLSNDGSHNNVAVKVVRLAIQTMIEELAPNLWEDDLDRLVDFGHLVSPALEMKVLPALYHGEAVNIDMAYMCVVAYELGRLSLSQLKRILSCMQALELPIYHPYCDSELVKSALQTRFKHSGGKMRAPIPVGLGEAEIFNDIPTEVLERAEITWRQLSASYVQEKRKLSR